MLDVPSWPVLVGCLALAVALVLAVWIATNRWTDRLLMDREDLRSRVDAHRAALAVSDINETRLRMQLKANGIRPCTEIMPSSAVPITGIVLLDDLTLERGA